MAESRRPPEIKSNRKYLYHLILFVASVFIVVAISPREGKFRYEYQKGKPWLGQSLIAPRDFPVLKPDSEVIRERDSILKSFSPYFRLDNQVETAELSGFNKYITDLWEDYEKEGHKLNPRLFASFKKEIDSVLSDVYSRGVFESNESVFSERIPEEITVVVGKLAEKKQYSDVFDQKSAYQFVEAKKEELSEKYKSGKGKDFGDFIARVAMYDFIKPNLFYDQATSTAVKNRMIEEISLTRGLVQEGELIISQGEIVDDDKYVMLDSLRSEYEKRLGKNDKWFIIFGRFILIAASYLALYLFMYNFRFDVLSSTHKTFFIILVILLFLIITRLVIYLPGNAIYLIPFAIIPILVRTFYDSRLALFVYLIAIMLAGFIVPNSFEFVFLSYIAGVIVIFSLTNVYRRAKLFFAVLMVFLAYSVVYLGIGLMQEGSLAGLNWKNYMWFAGNGVLLLLSYPLIFVFERTFGFLSDATLFELADTNQPLLRKLAEEAPGSFQHSLQVANLADEAAREIGANSLLARTGALYHDIGKTSAPEYFVENQARGFNPHDQLDPLESASIILNHVKNGVELARKFNLPSQIIDFIQTHHGTTVAYFFYKKFLDRNPRRTEMEKEFTYPGPRPSSRETAIVMMADAVEAASRTLAAYSEENINDLVERIIYLQEQDHQFANTPLTFRDITEIKNVFVKRLLNIYHARISYPVR